MINNNKNTKRRILIVIDMLICVLCSLLMCLLFNATGYFSECKLSVIVLSVICLPFSMVLAMVITKSYKFSIRRNTIRHFYRYIVAIMIGLLLYICHDILFLYNKVILFKLISALLSGCVFMLMVAKVPHFCAITVIGTVMGLFLFVSGHFAVSLVIGVACSVVADFIAKMGEYKNKDGLLISYIVFSYGLTGPVLPLWLMKDAYVESLLAKGKDTTYIENLFAHINTTTFFVCIAATVVLAIIGGVFGQKMMKKHFKKAGMIA